jgi:hypothetical protein
VIKDFSAVRFAAMRVALEERREMRFTTWEEIRMLLLVIVLLLLFGGGGGYYGYSRWGNRGGIGIFGVVLIIALIVYLFGGLRI